MLLNKYKELNKRELIIVIFFDTMKNKDNQQNFTLKQISNFMKLDMYGLHKVLKGLVAKNIIKRTIFKDKVVYYV